MQSEAEQKEFIKLYGAILKVTNILSSFADFESFMNSKKKEELDKIIAEENLNKEKHITLFKDHLNREE